jgi:hypothetical protein
LSDLDCLPVLIKETDEMKIYKFWSLQKQNILIDGRPQQIQTYGGSNISMEDAAQKAIEKMKKIERKISGDHTVFEDYEVEIREEILQVIHEDAIITRNRYGASVLNVEKLLILDIDKPKPAFGDMFKKKDLQQDKGKIFDMVKKLATSSKYQGLGFRLYETAQGARVIITGRDFDARDDRTMELMKDFNCDPLYAILCQKQGCFRARLTPKPFRIKMRGYKVKFPSEADPGLEGWVSTYERESENFSVCKFIEQVGGQPFVSDVIHLHDELSRAHTNLKLA